MSCCPQGHPWTPDNTYLWRGWKKCRQCRNRHRDAKRALQPMSQRKIKRQRRDILAMKKAVYAAEQVLLTAGMKRKGKRPVELKEKLCRCGCNQIYPIEQFGKCGPARQYYRTISNPCRKRIWRKHDLPRDLHRMYSAETISG